MTRGWLLFGLLCAACLSERVENDAGTSSVVDAGKVSCSKPPPGSPEGERWARARTTVDQPDDFPDEYQIHVIYAEPSDFTGPVELDVDGSLRRSLAAQNTWVSLKTGGSTLRFDTCGGDIDITYVRLRVSDSAMATGDGSLGPQFVRDRLTGLLAPLFTNGKKLYLVYWEGLNFGRCGGAPWPPELRGHFTTINLGGIFDSTFLTASAPVGRKTLSVYSTSENRLPQPPFDATLGTEAVQVTEMTDTTVTLAQPLTAAHARVELLRTQGGPPDCRTNAFSSDGIALGYWEPAAIHECMHALGIVSRAAANFAAPPVAPAHLDETSQAGTNDLMYQGDQPWGCSGTFPTAAAFPCELDPGHRNYFQVPATSKAVDVAKSVFLSPTPSGAVAPPGW